MVWLHRCSVRLLSGHGNRGEEGASVIVFIGSPLPCLCTWHLSPPGGAANDFKLISRYRMGCLWWGRMPLNRERERWITSHTAHSPAFPFCLLFFFFFHVSIWLYLLLSVAMCSLGKTWAQRDKKSIEKHKHYKPFLASLDLKRQIQKPELCGYRGPLAHTQVISKTLVKETKTWSPSQTPVPRCFGLDPPRLSRHPFFSNLCLARQQLGLFAAPLLIFGIKL